METATADLGSNGLKNIARSAVDERRRGSHRVEGSGKFDAADRLASAVGDFSSFAAALAKFLLDTPRVRLHACKPLLRPPLVLRNLQLVQMGCSVTGEMADLKEAGNMCLRKCTAVVG